MLKITVIDNQEPFRAFKLEGKLLEPWVKEVMSVCTTGGYQNDHIRLDLSGLTFVDQAGAKLLRDMIRGGTTVSACSGFVAELLHLEKS